MNKIWTTTKIQLKSFKSSSLKINSFLIFSFILGSFPFIPSSITLESLTHQLLPLYRLSGFSLKPLSDSIVRCDLVSSATCFLIALSSSIEFWQTQYVQIQKMKIRNHYFFFFKMNVASIDNLFKSFLGFFS